MNDRQDEKVCRRLKRLLGDDARFVEVTAADRWELRASGLRPRRLVMRHVFSGGEIVREDGFLDIAAFRHGFRHYITHHGGTVVEPRSRLGRFLIRGTQVASPLLFAAWLMWIFTKAGLPSQLAVEVGFGATAMVAVHELGHVVTLRRFGIGASTPIFIPGLGMAGSSAGLESRDAKTEAIVGMAGPVLGTVAAYLGLGLFALTGWWPLVLIALAGFIINAFNMLPFVPLDGGRAAAAITPWLWPIGLAGAAAYVWLQPSLFAGLVLAGGTLTTIYRLTRSNRSGYYRVSWRARLAVLGTYLGTLGAIVGGIALGLNALALVH